MAYAIVGWVLLQVADTLFPALQLPPWTVTFVAALLALGFPVAIVLAWAYEITPGGIQRTRDDQLPEASSATSRTAGYALTAIVAASTGAMLFWLVSRDTDTQWLRETAVPEIESLIAAGDWEAAYSSAVAAESRVPKAPEIAELWPRLSWRATIPSEPTGATVYRRAYNAPSSEWTELGRTPLENIRLPFGLSVLRFEAEGYLPLVRTVGGGMVFQSDLPVRDPEVRRFDFLVGTDAFRLDSESSLPEGKVRIPGWHDEIDGERVEFQDFFLDRYEVTNAQYKSFVDAGGYEQPNLWDPVLRNGDIVPWEEAMELFTDRTGRPGPSTWSAGDFEEGQDDYPVSGVSWYEASAYARFMRQELPTVYHWQHAVAPATHAWLLPASNLNGTAARAVTESRAMSYAGNFDLTGNVREWLATPQGSEYVIVGGSWIDPFYVASSNTPTANPLDRSEFNGFRLAITRDGRDAMAAARTPLRPPEPITDRVPVPDETYSAYSGFFEIGPVSLNASVETVATTRVWTQERVAFDTGFSDDRMVVYLFLPSNGRPPYQTVVYWPGSAALNLNSINDYANHLDFVVKSGRAVAFPVYKDTFERRTRSVLPAAGTIADRDDAVQRIKEFRRTIDYLETRADIDRNAIAFYGHSWGSRRGSTAVAQEPRVRVAIFYVCCAPETPRPEIDPINALPRVTVPTLMLNGEYDTVAPIENARYLFGLLGTPEADKRWVRAPGTHFVQRDVVVRETLDWLDKYLGAPQR